MKTTRMIAAPHRGASCWLALFAAACAAPLATPEETEQLQRRMLDPFLQRRQVVCDELVVDMTGNFDICVTAPGLDRRLHRLDVSEKDGVIEKVWTNLTGVEAGWFTISIRQAPAADDVSGRTGPQTTYRVLNRFVRRTRGSGAITLSATATGTTVLVEEVGGPVQTLREFTVVDGVLQQ